MKKVSAAASLPAGSRRKKWILQTICFGLFLCLCVSMHYPWRSWVPYRLFLDLDPLHALAALSGTRQFFLLALVLIAASLVWGRIFCGYVCPLGFCFDLADRVVVRAEGEGAPGGARRVLGIHWVLLALVFVGLALKSAVPLALDPIGLLTRSFAVVFHPLGIWVANQLTTWFRPIAEQRGWYDLAYHAYVQPGFQAALGNLALLAAVLGLSLLTRRFWCRSVCPLGALLGLLARAAPARRRVAATCTTCGQCRDVCPMQAIGEDPFRTRQSACIQCKSCSTVCPVDAVSFSLRSRPAIRHLPVPEGFSRRGFFLGLGAGSMVIVLTKLDPRVMKGGNRRIRPPGALPEEDFLATCVRCGACLRICVTHTLQASGMENGLASWGTPVHNMRLAGCEQQCNLCGRICPTGAIRNLPLTERQHAKIGTAVLLRERCVAWAKGQLCLLCDEACPYNAIVFRPVEGHKRPFVDESRCNGCGMCEAVCPVNGEAAIVVYPLGEIRQRDGSYKETLNRERIFLEPKEDLLELPEREGAPESSDEGGV